MKIDPHNTLDHVEEIEKNKPFQKSGYQAKMIYKGFLFGTMETKKDGEFFSRPRYVVSRLPKNEEIAGRDNLYSMWLTFDFAPAIALLFGLPVLIGSIGALIQGEMLGLFVLIAILLIGAYAVQTQLSFIKSYGRIPFSESKTYLVSDENFKKFRDAFCFPKEEISDELFNELEESFNRRVSNEEFNEWLAQVEV